MASKPDFDPNDPNNYTANQVYLEELVRAEPELYGIYLQNEDGSYVTDEEGNRILDPEADYSGYFRDIMWKNKTITELYYPGSVFKVITAAMGLDSGKASYNTTLNCSGAYAVAKQTYHCAGRHSHGMQNLADALRNSCNIYFIQLGQRLGAQTFYDYFQAFGFTERTGVDLPNETSYMQYYTDQNMGEVELASSAFGQSMAVTPLQVCTRYCGVGQRGIPGDPPCGGPDRRRQRQRGAADRGQCPPPGDQRDGQRDHPPDHGVRSGGRHHPERRLPRLCGRLPHRGQVGHLRAAEHGPAAPTATTKRRPPSWRCCRQTTRRSWSM